MNGKTKVICTLLGVLVIVGGWIYSYASTQNQTSQNASDIESVKAKHYIDIKAIEAKQDEDHDILIEVRNDVKHIVEAIKER